MASNAPIATVYVRNLEERVKIETLKEALHELFSEFGTIVEIIAKTNLRAKGQAFIVFEKPEEAAAAVDEVHGFEFFGKPMEVALAKTRSDATVKSQGNEDDFEAHKRRRIAEKDKKRALEAAEEQKRLKRVAAGAPDAAARPIKGRPGLKSSNPGAPAVVPDEYLPPNKILFVQNLPEAYDIDAVTSIFSRFDGFREVRLVPGRRGIAFVEYENEQGAITAKENTANMVLSDSNTIKVTYQRQ
ncbi:RNA recognition domain-containing protein [Plectosphaerella plurivora]|uniref:RNA recognition domain-containing protein n=1 Tax=Plectosphaerella plurivora TaxID=936078 RepID=A0A9P8V0B3_9PEZI|nr:RNA recognition domain-containing protein [Plectosphaerella plurivora]